MITTSSLLVNNYTMNNTYDIYPYCSGASNTGDNNFSLDPTYYSYCAQSYVLNILAFLTLFIIVLFFIDCIFTCITKRCI
jgi:hypothetical protein